jgi:hypothetical protein
VGALDVPSLDEHRSPRRRTPQRRIAIRTSAALATRAAGRRANRVREAARCERERCPFQNRSKNGGETLAWASPSGRCGLFPGVAGKPSDGLEPSTPSLPSWARRGKRGHGRVTGGHESAVNWTNLTPRSDSRVDARGRADVRTLFARFVFQLDNARRRPPPRLRVAGAATAGCGSCRDLVDEGHDQRLWLVGASGP